jgi:hypothetical protein
MFGFITRLLGSDSTPAPAAPVRKSSLSLEPLETRETPSGISHALKSISHVLHSPSPLAQHASTATLVTSFTPVGHAHH